MSRAPVTRILLAVMALVFAAETMLGGSTNPAVLLRMGANISELVAAGQWWRLVTSMFLHIGVFHLLLNGWALYQLGSLYESWMGSRLMLVTFFISGIAGSLASVMWTRGLSAGASGAIFGVLGALISILWQRRDRLTPQAMSLMKQLAGWAAINVVYGLAVAGIDNAAHLGGFVGGLLIGLRALPQRERQV